MLNAASDAAETGAKMSSWCSNHTSPPRTTNRHGMLIRTRDRPDRQPKPVGAKPSHRQWSCRELAGRPWWGSGAGSPITGPAIGQPSTGGNEGEVRDGGRLQLFRLVGGQQPELRGIWPQTPPSPGGQPATGA